MSVETSVTPDMSIVASSEVLTPLSLVLEDGMAGVNITDGGEGKLIFSSTDKGSIDAIREVVEGLSK